MDYLRKPWELFYLNDIAPRRCGAGGRGLLPPIPPEITRVSVKTVAAVALPLGELSPQVTERAL